MFRFWCQNVQSQRCRIHCQDEFSRNSCHISERKQVNCFRAELFRRDQTDLCHLLSCFHRQHQICWFGNIKIYPCCCCYLMKNSKATPLTGEEWCSNAMMQVPGKWLRLSLHHVLFPTWVGLSRSGLGSLLGSQVSAVWERVACCSSATVFDPRCVSPSMIDVSPLRTWLTALTCSRPRSCRPSAAIDAPLRTKIRAELLESCCSFIYLLIFLESPGTEIQLASSPLWVMRPCCIYSPLFVFLLQIRRRFWREEILVLPHLCLLCLCIWVRALIQ